VDMFHRASWDLKEVCDRSIPQLEQGSKRPSASGVCSPTVFSASGITFLDSPPGGAGGLTPPQSTQGSLEEEKGLVPGKTKSEAVEPVTRPEAVPVGGTHEPRSVVPRTPAKGVFTGRNRTLLVTPVIAFLVL